VVKESKAKLGRAYIKAFPVRCIGYHDHNNIHKYAIGHQPIVLVSYSQSIKNSVKRCKLCQKKQEYSWRLAKFQAKHFHDNEEYKKMLVESVKNTLKVYEKLLMPWQTEFLQDLIRRFDNGE